MIEYTVKVNEYGSKFWFLNGKRHREDGPSCEWADGDKEWHLNGEKFSKDEWEKRNKKTHNIIDGKEIDGKEIELSDESFQNLKKHLTINKSMLWYRPKTKENKQEKKMDQFIASYLRKPVTQKAKMNALENGQKVRGEPKGVVVAMRNKKGDVSFGWSLCKNWDKFNKKRALDMAKGRAFSYDPCQDIEIPYGFKAVVTPEFMSRCETYFREKGLKSYLQNKYFYCPVTVEGMKNEVIALADFDLKDHLHEVTCHSDTNL